MYRKGVVALLVLFVLLGLAFSSPAGAAQWTFMVYLDADNNLEEDGVDDFLEMASVGSDSNINIVVQMDRIPGYDSRYGDWTSTKRFLVTQNMTPDPGNALSDLGEANMGDPATLTEFINWATTQYPATNYALIMWDHGGGWRAAQQQLQKALKLARSGAEKAAISAQLQRLNSFKTTKGVCWDDTNGGDYLESRELRSALDAATHGVSLIGFDACLMAMVEVAYEVRGTGPSVMVGSEKTEPGAGWPYNTVMAGLKANPAWSPAELGAWIVDKYYESYGNGQTQSSLNLAQMTNLGSVISTFATSMTNNWQTNQAAVQTEAQNVVNALNTAILHNQHGATYPGANGLTINFPTSGPDADYNGTIIQFAGNTTWDEFLTAYAANMGGSWIANCRTGTQTFDGEPYADLKDFCNRIINYTPPAPCDSTYTTSQPTYAFEDISATGANLNLGDESYARFDIPFTFNFYGSDYTTVSVCSNGGIYFADGDLGYDNQDIPGTGGNGVTKFIALFWDDLDPSAGGDVRWEVKGAAPNRRLIVQWTNVPTYDSAASGGTFQAVLYEGTNNICFNYQDVVFGNSHDNGASATVGLQRDATCGLKFSYNTASLNNSMSILFSRGAGPVPASSLTPIYPLLID